MFLQIYLLYNFNLILKFEVNEFIRSLRKSRISCYFLYQALSDYENSDKINR